MWRDIPGWKGLYKVSNTGLVYSVRSDKILTPTRQGGKRKQYEVVVLCRKPRMERWKVHILVLTVFVGPRPYGLIGRHLNDDQFNNHLDNLSWATSAQNAQDTSKNFRVGGQKVTEADRIEIYSRRKSGEKGRSLALEFGVSEQTICYIYKHYKRD